MKLTPKQKQDLTIKIACSVVETIKETGEQGAPSGPMYAALMSTGMSLEMYESMMQSLLNTGIIRKSGHVYFYVSPNKDK